MMKGQCYSFMFQYLAEVLLKILTYVAILINYKGRLKERSNGKSQGDHIGDDTQCVISASIPRSLEWGDSLSLSLLSVSHSSSLAPHFHPSCPFFHIFHNFWLSVPVPCRLSLCQACSLTSSPGSDCWLLTVISETNSIGKSSWKWIYMQASFRLFEDIIYKSQNVSSNSLLSTL